MKITDIKPMPYKPGELSYYQFIRGGIGSDYHQGPSFFSYEDGKVLLYWHAYDFDECSGNGVVLYSVSEDYGVTWSDPQVFMADYLGGFFQGSQRFQSHNSRTFTVLRVFIIAGVGLQPEESVP
jgi:hypothetical protein